ncbi:unnamed protein product [Allacma fusca]|uniref:Uncharacterized protein n=1 Tax=Allacma fusca TaxID=39272 RepID=A0A8J2PIL6_9HEXA|nr:unnamed protein product [Allacma fusca]
MNRLVISSSQSTQYKELVKDGYQKNDLDLILSKADQCCSNFELTSPKPTLAIGKAFQQPATPVLNKPAEFPEGMSSRFFWSLLFPFKIPVIIVRPTTTTQAPKRPTTPKMSTKSTSSTRRKPFTTTTMPPVIDDSESSRETGPDTDSEESTFLKVTSPPRDCQEQPGGGLVVPNCG